MTLQASGAISLQDIATEFGGATPHSISEYYRGGANVPNITQNNSIPISGQVSWSDYYGTVNEIIVPVTVTVGKETGAVPVDTGWAVSGRDHAWTIAPYSVAGAVSTTNLNGHTLISLGFDEVNGTAPRDFRIEFDGNVTATLGLKRIVLRTQSGSQTLTLSDPNDLIYIPSLDLTLTDPAGGGFGTNTLTPWTVSEANAGNVQYVVDFVFG